MGHKLLRAIKMSWKGHENPRSIFMVNENVQIHRIFMGHDFFQPIKNP